MANHFTLTLKEAHMLAPAARHMTFTCKGDQALRFKPGQFLQLHLTNPDGSPTKRSFSLATPLASNDEASEYIDLVVSYVEGGLASDILKNMQPGQTLESSGPYGRFCFMEKDANRRYLLLATGTGIAAYRAMRPQMAAMMAQRGCQITLLQGARNEEELLYGEEFEAFANNHPLFSYIPCFSRQQRPSPRPHDHFGYVQTMLPQLKPNKEEDIAYLCGNPDMVDQGYAALKEAGMSPRYIRREKYI